MTRTGHRQTNAAFTVSREYDVLDRVTNIVYAARDGTPLYRLSYAYDPDGLVTQRVAVSASGAVTNSYAYDGLMRLVAESDSPGNSASYVYDLCGNRLSVTTPSGTVSSTYTHNRRDADTYDAGGRVTRTVNGRGQLLDLAWNLRGELVSVSTNGVFAEGYAYDALGRRVSTTDESGTVYHAYDGIHCVADLAPDGALLRSYTWGSGIDNLLAVTLYGCDATNTLYAVTDPLGTVHALVGTNGVPAVTYAYDSWGNLFSVSGDESPAASLRFTWQGREYSHATGLYNFRARWYDPATGRWLSKDPIGLEGGLNLYEAFGNNPVNRADPFGLTDVNYFATNDDLYAYANRYNPTNVITVGGHGDPDGIYDKDNNPVTIDSLAQKIRELPKFRNNPKIPVRLESCNVGNGTYPQQLSNVLQTEVYAPNTYTWYSPTGGVSYAGKLLPNRNRPDESKPGRQIRFVPQQNNSSAR